MHNQSVRLLTIFIWHGNQHFAKVLAGAGAKLIVGARRVEKLDELANDIKASGGGSFINGVALPVDGGHVISPL